MTRRGLRGTLSWLGVYTVYSYTSPPYQEFHCWEFGSNICQATLNCQQSSLNKHSVLKGKAACLGSGCELCQEEDQEIRPGGACGKGSGVQRLGAGVGGGAN